MMRRTSGYALAIVLGVLTLLGLSLLLLSQVLGASVEETKRSYAEQRATYACDSAARVAGADAEAVMSADSEATSATAMAALCSDLGPCLGDLEDADCTESCDYRINSGTGAGPRRIFAADVVAERFSLRVASGTGSSSIRTGAFRSLLALRQRLSLSVAARHDASGALCRANNSFTVVQLSPAQLMLASMVPVDWLPRGIRNPSGDLRLVGPSAYVDGATRIESANLTRVVATGRSPVAPSPGAARAPYFRASRARAARPRSPPQKRSSCRRRRRATLAVRRAGCSTRYMPMTTSPSPISSSR